MVDQIREAKIKTFLKGYFNWEQEDDKRPLLDYFPSGMPVEELPERVFLPYAPEGMCPLVYPVVLVEETEHTALVEWPSPPFAQGLRDWVPKYFLLSEADAMAFNSKATGWFKPLHLAPKLDLTLPQDSKKKQPPPPPRKSSTTARQQQPPQPPPRKAQQQSPHPPPPRKRHDTPSPSDDSVLQQKKKLRSTEAELQGLRRDVEVLREQVKALTERVQDLEKK